MPKNFALSSRRSRSDSEVRSRASPGRTQPAGLSSTTSSPSIDAAAARPWSRAVYQSCSGRRLPSAQVTLEPYPGREDHLKSKYLVFIADFDGPLEQFVSSLVAAIPDVIDSVWSHCVGYPGSSKPLAVLDYIRDCQVDTTLYFGGYPGATVDDRIHRGVSASAVRRAAGGVSSFPCSHGEGAHAGSGVDVSVR